MYLFLYMKYIIIHLNICKYIHINNIEAPFACIYLINQPLFTSLIIYSTESNAKDILGI